VRDNAREKRNPASKYESIYVELQGIVVAKAGFN